MINYDKYWYDVLSTLYLYLNLLSFLSTCATPVLIFAILIDRNSEIERREFSFIKTWHLVLWSIISFLLIMFQIFAPSHELLRIIFHAHE